MKNILKKISIITLSITILVPYFFTPLAVTAKSQATTLRELRQELAEYKAQKAKWDSAKAKTQSEINNNKNTISKSQTEIEYNKNKIEQAKIDIENLERDIRATESKIEDIMRAYEIASGDNNYLEYIFKATSLSDFVVRYSVSEQIASYNEELINDYEAKILENEQLQEELKNRQIELDKKIIELEEAINNLGNDLSSYVEEAIDAQSDIDATQKLIDHYVKLGCKEDENLVACANVIGSKSLIRPLQKGTITSHFGYRIHPVTGKVQSLHSGTDIGGNPEGTNVYSAANGKVAKIIWRASCGGNQVYIHHTVSGVQYTTGYMHLLTINVKVGDTVTNDTVIGTVGGGAGTRSYETCSTGAHLHFMVATGWYGSTYTAYSTFVSNLKDPTTIVKFPPKYTYFYSRY